MNTYGSLSPRTAAYVVRDLLKRGTPYLVFEKFGQARPLPKRSSKTIKFRRYFLNSNPFTGSSFNPYEYYGQDGTDEIFNLTAKTLSEGITPDATDLESEDITATLTQYGDRTEISDVVEDTHEDPVLQEAVEILGEQAAYLIEMTRYNALVGGTNVFYANGDARDEVNSGLTLNLQRQITRQLKRNLAKPITNVVRSTANYGTEAISPAFVAVCHPDCEADIRGLAGFVPAEKYGTMTAWEGEIGKVESVRYIVSTVVKSFGAVGATGGTDVLEGTGDKAYVYPIFFFARDAFGIVPLKGKSAITPMVINPNTPSDSDPLGQRGHAGWKAYSATVILNQHFMARAEVAVSDLA